MMLVDVERGRAEGIALARKLEDLSRSEEDGGYEPIEDSGETFVQGFPHH